MIAIDIFGELPKQIGDGITVTGVRHHSKASEAYVDVSFKSGSERIRRISVPVNERRTGVDASSEKECVEIIKAACTAFQSEHEKKWLAETREHWDKCNQQVTREFFDVMLEQLGEWVCQRCQLPENPNWARRTQEIKEHGFTVATFPKMECEPCGAKTTHLMLLPIPRGVKTGYETWSASLRKRIMAVLKTYDAYEGRTGYAKSLLPDHKFPEARWDRDTRQENPNTMTDGEIDAKFQLLSNQRNQQKREVCRKCFQTDQRGYPFGIPFFYQGSIDWPEDVPKRGKAAEKGCKGCGWYDFAAWRAALTSHLGGQQK